MKSIRLVAGKGSAEAGTGPGGEYWHIFEGAKRVGKVFVNVTETPQGNKASLQIFINKTDQGRGLGTQGYRLACAQTKHPMLYAYIRKSNPASIRAAEKAGFVIDTTNPGRQLVMIYKK